MILISYWQLPLQGGAWRAELKHSLFKFSRHHVCARFNGQNRTNISLLSTARGFFPALAPAVNQETESDTFRLLLDEES